MHRNMHYAKVRQYLHPAARENSEQEIAKKKFEKQASHTIVPHSSAYLLDVALLVVRGRGSIWYSSLKSARGAYSDADGWGARPGWDGARAEEYRYCTSRFGDDGCIPRPPYNTVVPLVLYLWESRAGRTIPLSIPLSLVRQQSAMHPFIIITKTSSKSNSFFFVYLFGINFITSLENRTYPDVTWDEKICQSDEFFSLNSCVLIFFSFQMRMNDR